MLKFPLQFGFSLTFGAVVRSLSDVYLFMR